MAVEPLFVELDGTAVSRRFVVLHLPDGGVVPRGLVVHAPAFAEEMNKARRMVALQARALARDGIAVLVPDLLGCGDSPGDFGDASWQAWVQDILNAHSWLGREFERRWPRVPRPPIGLWGLRVGALLASAAACRLQEPTPMVLWQPTLQGRGALQQFLRLLAAGEIINGKASVGVSVARQALGAGIAQEVAGYLLSPAVAAGLEAAVFDLPSRPAAITAIELSMRDEATFSPALESASARWRASGWRAHLQVVRGPSFWQTSEIEDAPAVIEATCAALRNSLASMRTDPAAAHRA